MSNVYRKNTSFILYSEEPRFESTAFIFWLPADLVSSDVAELGSGHSGNVKYSIQGLPY